MFQKVNDINLYYEMTGQGKPFLLLHGNGESHKIFNELIKQLSFYGVKHRIYYLTKT